MNVGLRLVEPLRWGDVKDREGGCEQFWTKHARNVNGFDGSHDDADERERAISSSQLYSAFANSCPLQTDTFLFALIHSHNVILSSNKFY